MRQRLMQQKVASKAMNLELKLVLRDETLKLAELKRDSTKVSEDLARAQGAGVHRRLLHRRETCQKGVRNRAPQQ